LVVRLALVLATPLKVHAGIFPACLS